MFPPGLLPRAIMFPLETHENGQLSLAVVVSAAVPNHFMLEATKSQFTRFQNDSTYFGRALR